MSGRSWVRWAGLVAGLAILGALAWTVADAWDVVTSFDWQPSAGWLVLAVVALLDIGSGSAVGPAAWLVLGVPLAALLLHPRVFGPASAWALRRAPARRPPRGSAPRGCPGCPP